MMQLNQFSSLLSLKYTYAVYFSVKYKKFFFNFRMFFFNLVEFHQKPKNNLIMKRALFINKNIVI